MPPAIWQRLQELGALLRAQAAIRFPEIGDVTADGYFIGAAVNALRRVV